MTPEQYDNLFANISEYIEGVVPELRSHEDNVVNDVLNLFFSFAKFKTSDEFWDYLTLNSISSIKEIGATQFVPLFEGLYANADKQAKQITGLFKKSRLVKARTNLVLRFGYDFNKIGGWKIIMESYLAKYIIDNYQGKVDLGI